MEKLSILSFDSDPRFAAGGNLGSLLYGDVFVMFFSSFLAFYFFF